MDTRDDTILKTYAHLMLEHLPMGIALFDAHDQRLLAANARYQEFYSPEWQQGRAIGRSLIEFLPHAEYERIASIFRKVALTGVTEQSEVYEISSITCGSTYWNWTLHPISDQGNVRYLLLTAIDVTSEVRARKLAEQEYTVLTEAHSAVEMERQRLEHTGTILLSLQNASEPKMLAQAALRAIDTCFSPHLLALYRVHHEHETLSLLASNAHSSTRPVGAVFPAFLSRDRGGVPLEAMSQHSPFIRRRSQGIFQKEQGVRGDLLSLPEIACVVYIPLWGKRCEGILVAGFTREEDAHDLLMQTLSTCAPHLAEALVETQLHTAIEGERQRLRTILDQLPEGVLLVDARTSNVSYANPAAARLLGSELPQLVGTPLNQSALLSPYRHSRQGQQPIFYWNLPLIHALWGKTSMNQEFALTRPDGSEVIVLSSTAPVRLSNGLIGEAVITFQDITALKQLERQKNEFFAVANHELRTPLTVILGFTELLRLSTHDNVEGLYEYAMTSIAQECDNLLRLIEELLDVTRLEQTRLKLWRNYRDLLAPLKHVVNEYISTTQTHRFHLTLEDLGVTDILMGWFDLQRIEQVLTNLITNGIKYSPDGNEIEVGVRPHRDARGIIQEVLIWVKDQGIGIAPGDIPHIFERFYRADTLDNSISGFGIGLYLVKEFVQGHGGRIWVQSTLGEGSTFFVVLPLKDSLLR